MTVKEMIKTEIEKLPENLLAKASQELSTALFEKIRDDKEDAVYRNY
jgi:hypothetical protein